MFKSYEKRLDRLKNYARKYILLLFSLRFYNEERNEEEKEKKKS